MSAHKRLRRSDLFLVRLWTEEDEEEDQGSAEVEQVQAGDKRHPSEWHGKVQRVVDGESHQFDDWQGLVNLFQAMLNRQHDERAPKDRDSTDVE